VQVKNKPCVKYTTAMRLISWIHTRGRETIMSNVNDANFFIHILLKVEFQFDDYNNFSTKPKIVITK
jgi:hypothetical protein